jgi:hypothetical protein
MGGKKKKTKERKKTYLTNAITTCKKARKRWVESESRARKRERKKKEGKKREGREKKWKRIKRANCGLFILS